MRAMFVAVGAAILAGCAVPAYQLDLSNTEWTILAIDSRPIQGASIRIADDEITAVIDTPCR